MADTNSNASRNSDPLRPKGNRPADNARQATPASLLAQMNWQGSEAAQDFLGLNEDPPQGAAQAQAPAMPKASAPQAARSLPPVAVASPQSSDASWLMDDNPQRQSELDAPEEDPEPLTVEDDGEPQELRAPAVLDASWSEPRKSRSSKKSPLFAACAGLALVGVAALVFVKLRAHSAQNEAASQTLAQAEDVAAPKPEAKPWGKTELEIPKSSSGTPASPSVPPSGRVAVDRSGRAAPVVVAASDPVVPPAPVQRKQPEAAAPAAPSKPKPQPANARPKFQPAPVQPEPSPSAQVAVGNPLAPDPQASVPESQPAEQAPSSAAAVAPEVASAAPVRVILVEPKPSPKETALAAAPQPSAPVPTPTTDSAQPQAGSAAPSQASGESVAALVPTIPVTPPQPVSVVPSVLPPVREPLVRVITSTSTPLGDALTVRPVVDEHRSAVPTEVAGGASPADASGAPAKAPEAASDAIVVGPTPAIANREGTLDPRDVLLPAPADTGVRTAQAKDMTSVWDADSIPMQHIAAKPKVLTPQVGNVRVKLKSKDVFDGKLYAIGENAVWIEGPYGRMGLDNSRIASVEKLPADNPAGATKGAVAGNERVRVKTPGGLVFGRLITKEDSKVMLVTDAGLTLTVDAKDVEYLTPSPTLVIKKDAPKQ